MRRVPELDAVRGLAALMVVLFHFRPQTFRGGWTAVDLFFVLSGYLITSIVLRHGNTPHFFRSFYARRTLRIWPIYYLTLLVFILVNPHLPQPLPDQGLPYYLTFTQNIQYYDLSFPGTAPNLGAPLYPMWSLALEEQFYLFWPLIIILVGQRRLIPLSVGVVILGALARYRGYNLQILISRCDGFALGSLLAALTADRDWISCHAGRFRALLGALGVLSFVGLVWVIRAYPNGGGTAGAPCLSILLANLFYFAAVGLVVLSAGSRYLAPLRWRWLGYIGLISYGLYIYHGIMFAIIDYYEAEWGLRARWWFDAIKLATPFAMAIVSWHFIEQPILSLKDRFAYSHGRPPQVEVVGAEARAEPA